MTRITFNAWPLALLICCSGDAASSASAHLADRGHPEAARIALQMQREGHRVYAQRYAASPRQIEHWARIALPALQRVSSR